MTVLFGISWAITIVIQEANSSNLSEILTNAVNNALATSSYRYVLTWSNLVPGASIEPLSAAAVLCAIVFLSLVLIFLATIFGAVCSCCCGGDQKDKQGIQMV